MLEKDYKQTLATLIDTVNWDIVLPEGHEAFFGDNGSISPCTYESRSSPRMRARGRGILYYEETLRAFPRTQDPMGIYTMDFSKTGIGFVASCQFLPEEVVRIVLPTFWARLRITRCTRNNDKRYDSGGSLITWHQPSPEAFETLQPS
ncbi:hypothetical protein CA51_23710 [Rosistilla oblonga]|uniref:PilZ domain-containing protein n=1 Tax=Rosistilla oblonga TaxID=2527990 RepID=A0A518J239_9BACT|nr:hypothetical protein [Rosistilla oblonga]QDV12488.1 hypothetical protein CA51_23710 [Rosistilla oblonga]QDV59399.1 hypothetical protein Mal33_54340 [Rosistilla oblonga]